MLRTHSIGVITVDLSLQFIGVGKGKLVAEGTPGEKITLPVAAPPSPNAPRFLD